MRARYAGTCSRTGKRYSAGAEIEKYGSGWAIVGSRSISSSSSSATAVDIRPVRVDGEIRHENLARVVYCKCAKSVPGLDTHSAEALAPYTLVRSETDFTCPTCGRVIHILTEDEVWSEVTLPGLYLQSVSGRLTLSRKVGAAKWELVKQYFRFWSADNLEDEDEFDMEPGWYLNSRANIDAVEDALGILPENRFAVRQMRLGKERDAEIARQAERQAIIDRLEAAFPRNGGEYVQPAEGKIALEGVTIDHPAGGRNIYGGGRWFVVEPDGRYIWSVVNNGMDGDDWSRNNVATGGAGAIGNRFESTPERLDALRALPGGENIGRTRDERMDAILRALHHNAMTPDLRDLPWPDRPLAAVTPKNALWVEVGGTKIGMTDEIDRSRIFLLSKWVKHWSEEGETICGREFDEILALDLPVLHNCSCVCLEYPATTKLRDLVISRLPEWVGSSVPGRFYVQGRVCDNAADAVRLASRLGEPFNSGCVSAVITPDGPTIVFRDKNLILWSDGETTTSSSAVWGVNYWTARERFGAPISAAEDEASFPGFPPLPAAPETVSKSVSPDASKLISIALRSPEWRESGTWRRLLQIDTIDRRIKLDHYERRGRGSASEATLTELSVTLRPETYTLPGTDALATGNPQPSDPGSLTRSFYLVEWGWGCLGEDGDAGEEKTLHEDLASARASFVHYKEQC